MHKKILPSLRNLLDIGKPQHAIVCLYDSTLTSNLNLVTNLVATSLPLELPKDEKTVFNKRSAFLKEWVRHYDKLNVYVANVDYHDDISYDLYDASINLPKAEHRKYEADLSRELVKPS